MGQWFNRRGSNLATVARETGYPVIEVPGWTRHGHGPLGNHVAVIVCHHTAGPEPERTRSNYPSFNVVRNGRSGLPGPLAHYGIGFDGTIYVFAAGLAYHAGTGSWRGWSGNSVALGIEAEDSGDGDWTRAQLDVYPRLCAALCQFLGVGAGAVCGHKEWTSRKIDPAGINMPSLRGRVTRYLKNPHTIRRGGGGPKPRPQRPKLELITGGDVLLPHGEKRSVTLAVPARDVQLVIGVGYVDFDVHAVKFIGSPGAKGVNYVKTLDGQHIDAGRPMRIADVPDNAVVVEISYSHSNKQHDACAGFRQAYKNS